MNENAVKPDFPCSAVTTNGHNVGQVLKGQEQILHTIDGHIMKLFWKFLYYDNYSIVV